LKHSLYLLPPLLSLIIHHELLLSLIIHANPRRDFTVNSQGNFSRQA